MSVLDAKQVLEIQSNEFFKRYDTNKDKMIDNSSLHAGSPMYYYCEGCCTLVATIPEGAWNHSRPKYCNSCKQLSDLGAIERLRKEAEERLGKPKRN
jgi:hypothetical protein